ncbi:hypothetical protein [Sinomonas gamaensis]|uniref:hypothetical protein n=1 Tax=Sinomonas gamaensis TaxID=2565624 RepID=UPI0011092BF8|nr:hypothetical protein [Sinomonas gamaensis]
MRNEKGQAGTERGRSFRPSYSGMRINAGGGSLVSNDLSLNEEQAGRAIEALLARAVKTVAAARAARENLPEISGAPSSALGEDSE